MSRLQLALNVDDLDESIAFYTQAVRHRAGQGPPGYANFAVAEPPLKLVLIENPGQGGSHQPPRRRGRRHRRGRRRDRPGWPAPDSPRSTSAAPPAATPSRTSSGSRARPTASGGRSTPCSATRATFGCALEPRRQLRDRRSGRSRRCRLLLIAWFRKADTARSAPKHDQLLGRPGHRDVAVDRSFDARRRTPPGRRGRPGRTRGPSTAPGSATGPGPSRRNGRIADDAGDPVGVRGEPGVEDRAQLRRSIRARPGCRCCGWRSARWRPAARPG